MNQKLQILSRLIGENLPSEIDTYNLLNIVSNKWGNLSLRDQKTVVAILMDVY